MNEKKKQIILSVAAVLIWMIAILQSGKLLLAFEEENHYSYSKGNVKQSETRETFLLKNVTLKEGEYRVCFDYSSEDDLKMQVLSVAGYSLDTDSFSVFAQETVPAGENMHFESSFSMEDETMMVSVVLNSPEGTAPAVSELKIENTQRCYTDAYIYCLFYVIAVTVVCFAILYIILSKKITGKLNAGMIFASLIIICLLANALYFTEATPNGHDIAFHMRRVEGLALSIEAGEIPQRINTVFNAGYGYINPVMYPELFLYFPALLIVYGASTLCAMKIFYIVVNCATAFIAYYSFRKISDSETAGVLLSAVYTLSFYRMENVYLRGAMGESLFMVFLPLAVYALYTIMQTDRKRWLLFALSVSAIIQSHILGSLFTVIILGCEFVVFSADLLIKKKFDLKIITECIKSVIFTVFLNLWFIVPFLYYFLVQKFMMFDKDVQLENFFMQIIPLKSMLSLKIVQTNVIENMGLLVMSAAVLSLIMYVFSVIRKREDIILLSLQLAVTFLFALACTDVFPWKALSRVPIIFAFITTIQFSFRFYGIFICALCVFIGIVVQKMPKNRKEILLLPVVIVISALSVNDFFINGNMGKSDGRYNDYYYDAPNEYLMDGAILANEIGNPQKVRPSENITITEYSKERDNITLQIVKTDDSEGYIKLPLFYYYGYQAISDTGERLNLVSGENGCLTCVVTDRNISKIDISFSNERKIFRYPLIGTGAFICCCIVYCIYDKMKHGKKVKEA